MKAMSPGISCAARSTRHVHWSSPPNVIVACALANASPVAPERHGDEHKGGEATSRMHHNNDARSILSPECEPTAMAAGCVRRRVAQLSSVVDARAIGSKSNAPRRPSPSAPVATCKLRRAANCHRGATSTVPLDGFDRERGAICVMIDGLFPNVTQRHSMLWLPVNARL